MVVALVLEVVAMLRLLLPMVTPFHVQRWIPINSAQFDACEAAVPPILRLGCGHQDVLL